MAALGDLSKFQALPGLADILAKLKATNGVYQGTQGLDALAQPHAQPLPFSPTTPIGGAVGMGGTAGPTYPSTAPNAPYTGATSFTPLGPGKFPVVDPTPTAVPSPSVVAPEIQRVALEAWSRWPSLTNMGTYNVRNIAGTNTPSQHSYGDAIDIGGTPTELEEVATWAARRAKALGITQVIFRDRIWTDTEGWHPYTSGGHESHVHITGPQTYSDTSPSFPTVSYNPAPTRRPVSSPSRVSRTETAARRRRQI